MVAAAFGKDKSCWVYRTRSSHSPRKAHNRTAAAVARTQPIRENESSHQFENCTPRIAFRSHQILPRRGSV